jgi:transcriptional regulator with XRE-family HTH domain
MSVGSYLRGARESRQLSLREISEITKINRQLLIDLEKGDLSRWPKHRVYRHGYLRSYAIAVGLDPKKVLAKFDDEFGDPHPVAFHKSKTPASPPVPVTVLRTGLQVTALLVFIGAALNVFAPFEGNTGMTRPVAHQMPADKPADSPLSQESLAAAVAEVAVPEAMADGEIEGELRIISNPPQAHVTINGIGRGKTPVHVRYLPLGSYTIRVIHPEFMVREARVTLQPDEPSRTVRVALRDSPTVLNATLR